MSGKLHTQNILKNILVEAHLAGTEDRGTLYKRSDNFVMYLYCIAKTSICRYVTAGQPIYHRVV